MGDDGSLMDDRSFISLNIMVVDSLVDGNLLHLSSEGSSDSDLRSINVGCVVTEGWADIHGVSVVVCALKRNIVILRSGHSEVKWVVRVILVVIGIILVTMGVLRGHVVVAGVHVVLGSGRLLGGVDEMTGSRSVLWFLVVLGSGLSVMGSRFRVVRLGGVRSFMMRSLVVLRGSMVRCLVMLWCGMMCWSSVVGGGLVMLRHLLVLDDRL